MVVTETEEFMSVQKNVSILVCVLAARTALAGEALPASLLPENACLQLNAPIQVSALNARVDDVRLVAGTIPEKKSEGVVVMGDSPLVDDGASLVLEKSSPEVTVQLRIPPSCKNESGKKGTAPCEADIQGTIQITPTSVSKIAKEFTGTLETAAQAAELCVSGIAIDAVRNGGRLVSAKIYLYLNGTNTAVELSAPQASTKDMKVIDEPVGERVAVTLPSTAEAAH